MLNQFSRTQILLGEDGMNKLTRARVAVFGIGGVGGYAVEALARSGVGTLDLFDDDRICITNINRQLHATHATVGQYKIDAAKARVLEINPACVVNTHQMFYLPENAEEIDLTCYDYVVDAVDTMSAKLDLAERAFKLGVPLIACMGAGNKLDASAFEVADIFATSVCPLARVMRNELRKRGVGSLKVVYSKELPATPEEDVRTSCRANCVCPPDVSRKCTHRRAIPGSVAFVPSVAGLILAGEVVRGLTKGVRQ
ncbi:MAG: tRNA threonylcarbamoyladenosine dehydratase [Oscillospiraceae bacterium]|nr:tRNA threonylcarbamoyladenosine dehydratase [Oscillospiraceae bacterium]